MRRSDVTLSLDAAKCTGCGLCVEVCPHAVFILENRRARIQHWQACMECGACRRNCRYGAISVDSGVGCAAALITSALRGGEPCCGGKEGEAGCCG
jgi:NAD-dependent dihydropyrimidine dehydrogenase PreA subunit